MEECLLLVLWNSHSIPRPALSCWQDLFQILSYNIPCMFFKNYSYWLNLFLVFIFLSLDHNYSRSLLKGVYMFAQPIASLHLPSLLICFICVFSTHPGNVGILSAAANLYWCDPMLTLLTVYYSFRALIDPPLSFTQQIIPPFSLSSSWITAILNSPRSQNLHLVSFFPPNNSIYSSPFSTHNLPVPPPPLFFCLPSTRLLPVLPLPLFRTSGRYGVCAEQHVCTWMKSCT